MRTFSPKTQIPLDALFLRLRRNTHDNRQEQQGNDDHGPSNTQGNRMTGVRGNLRAVNHSKRSTLAEWTISVNDTKLHKNFTNTSRAFRRKNRSFGLTGTRPGVLGWTALGRVRRKRPQPNSQPKLIGGCQAMSSRRCTRKASPQGSTLRKLSKRNVQPPTSHRPCALLGWWAG